MSPSSERTEVRQRRFRALLRAQPSRPTPLPRDRDESSGRRLGLSSPFFDATLPDGSRLHAVIPDSSRTHRHINVRKFAVKADSSTTPFGWHRAAPRGHTPRCRGGERTKVLVAGGTQAGKPTTCQYAP
jgi:Flp pilus assembly CpaF family ATPase